MTTYQSMMLSVCFGVSIGWLISGLLFMVQEFIAFIKKKIKTKHATAKREATETQKK